MLIVYAAVFPSENNMRRTCVFDILLMFMLMSLLSSALAYAYACVYAYMYVASENQPLLNPGVVIEMLSYRSVLGKKTKLHCTGMLVNYNVSTVTFKPLQRSSKYYTVRKKDLGILIITSRALLLAGCLGISRPSIPTLKAK